MTRVAWRVNRLMATLKARLLARLLRPPVPARHAEYSMILSVDDDPAKPSGRLIDLAVRAIQAAGAIDLTDVSDRMVGQLRYPDMWPGEHYRLLAALVQVERPALVVEIGTAQGWSALAMKKFTRADGEVATFDIAPWSSLPRTCLKEADFQDGRLTHHIGDLSDPQVFARYSPLLERADMIFADAPKDGRFEPLLLQHLERLRFQKPMLLIFDDIRIWKMLAVWRQVDRPKLDLTSFGHWTGTGLVDWTAGPSN